MGLLATRPGVTTLAGIFAAHLLVTSQRRGGRDRRDRQHRPVVLCFFVGARSISMPTRSADFWIVVACVSGGANLGTGPSKRVQVASPTACCGLRCASGAVRRFNLIGDYSYGLYILCFPSSRPLCVRSGHRSGLVRCSFPPCRGRDLVMHFIGSGAEAEGLDRRQRRHLLRGGQQRYGLLGRGTAPRSAQRELSHVRHEKSPAA